MAGVGGVIQSLSDGGFPRVSILGQAQKATDDAPAQEAESQDSEEGSNGGSDEDDEDPLPPAWKVHVPVSEVGGKLTGMMQETSKALEAVDKAGNVAIEKMGLPPKKEEESSGGRGSGGGKSEATSMSDEKKVDEDPHEDEDIPPPDPEPWPVELPPEEARGKMKALIDDAEKAAIKAGKQKGKSLKVIEASAKKAATFVKKMLADRDNKLKVAKGKGKIAKMAMKVIDAKIAKEKSRLAKKGDDDKKKKKKGDDEEEKKDGKGDEDEKKDEDSEEDEKEEEPDAADGSSPAPAGNSTGADAAESGDITALRAELEKAKKMMKTMKRVSWSRAKKYEKVTKELKRLEKKCASATANTKAEEHRALMELMAKGKAHLLPMNDVAARATMANQAVQEIYKLVAVPVPHKSFNHTVLTKVIEKTATKVVDHTKAQVRKAQERTQKADAELAHANAAVEQFEVSSYVASEQARLSSEKVKETTAEKEADEKVVVEAKKEAEKAAEGTGKDAGGKDTKGKGKSKGKEDCDDKKDGKKGKGKEESKAVKKLKGKMKEAKEHLKQVESGELNPPKPRAPNSYVEPDASGLSPQCIACKSKCEGDHACIAMCYSAGGDKAACPGDSELT